MEYRALRGSGNERGAALVEFALVLPLLLMLLLGIATAGIAYNHKLSLTHAAREAGRFGATLPVTNFGNDLAAMDAWLDVVAARAVSDAAGTLAPGTPGLTICVAFVHPGGSVPTDSTRRRMENSSGVLPNSVDTCFVDGRPNGERRVQVSVAREAELNVVLYQQTLDLASQATNLYEAALGF